MKRRIAALILCAVTAISLLASGCGSKDNTAGNTNTKGSADAETESNKGDDSAAGEVYEITYANLGSAGGPMDRSAEKMQELLDELSMEKLGYKAFKINIYPGGQLGASDEEDFELVMSGQIQYSYCPGNVLAAKVPEAVALNAVNLPYLFPSDDAFYEFANSDFIAEQLDIVKEKTGVRVTEPWILGWVWVSSNKNEIHVPSDIKGQKIRCLVSEIWTTTMSAYGCSPTPIVYSEVYTALQQGTVDGIVAGTASYQDGRFYEVLDYISDASGLLNEEYPIWNQAWIDSLPDDVKAVLEEAIAQDQQIRREVFDADNETVVGTIEDSGTVLTFITDEERAEWETIAKAQYEKMADICGGMENIEAIQNWLSENGY